MKLPTTTSGRRNKSAGSRRQAFPDLWQNLKSLLTDSLFKNGLALISSAAMTSILGFLFWVIAARLYTSEEVGVGAVLISTMLALANLAQLNLGNFLNRFLPASGWHASRVILTSYGIGMISSLIFSSIFVVLSDWLFPQIGSVLGDHAVAVAFVVSNVAWTVFMLQDSALSGLRQSVWVPIENSLYAIIKLGLLFVFVGTALQKWGAFAAWNTPIIAIIIATNILIFARLLRNFNLQPPTIALPGLRKFTGLMGWDYLGTISIMSAIGIAPLMVLEFAGASATAGYHICWAITYSLYLISRSMGISMVVECSIEPARSRALVADAIVYSTLPLAGVAFALVVGAPVVLNLFGPAYVEANTNLLRLLVLSSVPWGLVTLYVAVARSRGRTMSIALVQAGTLIMVFSVGYFLLPRFGATGMAAAWLVAHLTSLSVIVVIELVRNPNRLILTVASLISALARLVSTFKSRYAGDTPPGTIPQTILDELDTLSDGRSQKLFVSGLVPGVNETNTYVVSVQGEDANDADRSSTLPVAFMKWAKTPEGIEELRRHRDTMELLSGAGELSDMREAFPEILSYREADDGAFVIQKALHGEEGRKFLKRNSLDRDGLKSAAEMIDRVHLATSRETIIDDNWIGQWVDEPAKLLLKPVRSLMAEAVWQGALDAFRSEQRQFWHGKAVRLGLYHGDYSPGNLFFESKGDSGQTPVSGILDWDGAITNGPPGLDICHLALTTRLLVRGEELGFLVRELLARKAWEPGELAWMIPQGAGSRDVATMATDPQSVRAVVGLAWLHHIANNLHKSQHFAASRLWAFTNVEWVLREYAKD